MTNIETIGDPDPAESNVDAHDRINNVLSQIIETKYGIGERGLLAGIQAAKIKNETPKNLNPWESAMASELED